MTLYRRAIAVCLLVAASAGAGFGQGCNPAVDGTYCATEGVRTTTTQSPFNTSPIFSLSEQLGPNTFPDQPATLGAITFGTDGSRCMGLMRRSRCKD